MTNHDDRSPAEPDLSAQRQDAPGPETGGPQTRGAPSSVPSWVDEVLGSSGPSADRSSTPTQAFRAGDPAPPAAARPENDLRIPEPPRPQASHSQASPEGVSLESGFPGSGQPGERPTAPTRPYTDADADDWIARATGGAARTPGLSAQPTVTPRTPDPWDTRPDMRPTLTRPPTSGQVGQVPSDIQQKRLIAGLLAIVLGSFGAHKFYLGMNTPALIMLGVNVGTWVLAVLLGLLTFGLGLFITLPLAGLVSGALGLLGLIEGILYLTKSDEEFYAQYVLDKKPWL